MRKKRQDNSYHSADIIIAVILGGVIGFTISLMTGELLAPIIFPGDIILAFMIAGGVLGIFGGRRSADWLEDLLTQLREFWYWNDR